MPNEFDTNKNQLDLFSYSESKQNQQDKRQKLASSGFTATVWTLSGVVLAACSLFEDDEGLGGESVSVLASPVHNARLYFDINGDGVVDEEDVRIQNEQYPGGFITNRDGLATGIPLELHGRPYIADLNGARDAITGQILEGQYPSLQDEDGNHLVASPITALIADAIADSNQPNSVSDVVTTFAPSGVDVAELLEELRSRDSYLPGTESSERVIALSKYLADNKAREVVGREDTIAEQIAESQRIIEAVESGIGGSDAIVVVNEDADTTTPDVVDVDIEVGEHDSYVGIINAFAQDGSQLSYTLTETDGSEYAGVYTINARGGISFADSTIIPVNVAETFNVEISNGNPADTQIVVVTVTPDSTVHELMLDEQFLVGDIEENVLGSTADPLIAGIEVAPGTPGATVTAADFAIRDGFLDVFASKFEMDFDTTNQAWNLQLKDGSAQGEMDEYLDYEAIPGGEFELYISVANADGDHSNILTVTIMVSDDPNDISFGGTLRADLREDGDVQANDELIAEGEVTIANQIDANGVRAQVMLNSAPVQSTGVQTLTLDHGTFTYNHETNAWTYTVDNTAAPIQALLDEQATTDIVTLTIDGGNGITHTQSIVLNVHGENEDVRFVDGDGNRITSDVAENGIEIGADATGGVNLGDVVPEIRGLLPSNDDSNVVLADDMGGLFSLDSATGILTFTGTAAQIAALNGSADLVLVLTAPASIGDEEVRLALRVNVINEVDDGRAEYEVTGDVDVGQTLTVSRVQGSDDPDGVVGAVSFQWFRGDESSPTLLGTGDTYIVTQTDIDSSDSIGVFVRYTDGSGTTYTHTDGDPTTTIAAFASPVSFTSPAVADRTIPLNENNAASAAVATVTATSEDDAGATVHIQSFALVDDFGGLFSISTTGAGTASAAASITIADANALDFETTESYTLRVVATDANTPPETATLTLTINVGDVNDNAPVFTQATYTADIDETLGNGAEVARVSARDDDGTTANNTVGYSITAGNTNNVFDIDDNGVITVLDASELDFETTPSYTLTITATDNGSPAMMDTATVTITVNDINDEPPMVNAPAGTIRTTTGNTANTNTGYSITVTDADAEATNDFRVDSDDRRFIFERDGTSDTWNLVLLPNQAVSLGDFTLGYTATDGANTDSGTVTISAVDSSVSFDSGRGSREAPPITEGDVTASDLEVIIAASTVTAGDPPISYAITAGDPRGIFALSTDGNGNRILTLASTTTSLDHESVPNGQYQVEITATEDAVAGTGNTAIATITVIVNDVEEGDANYIVAGNVQPTATLTAQLASAGDEDPDGRVGAVTYRWFVRDAADADPTSITDTNSAITWLTDASSAADANEFTLPATLESGGVYGVAISYLDGFADGSTPRGDATFQVELASAVEFLDADNNVLADSTYRPDPIAENTDSLPTVTARLETATFTYAITSGNEDGIFEIGGGTGANGAISVVSGKVLDFEAAEQHTLTIRVDEVGGDAFGFATVIIRVSDVNEHKPVFATDPALSTGTEEIAEDAANGTRVGLFRATDADGSNNDVTYSLDDGGLGVFGIREVTGTNNWEIYVLDNTRLDFESATKSYTIEITATDSDPDTTTRKSSGAEAFTINITDVNDNDPVLSATPVWEGTLDFGVPENTGTNVHLFTVSATDADENPSLTYEIVSIDGVALASIANPIFGIDASDGRVGLAGQLDRETKASHEIVIRAVDEGGRASEPQTFTVTVGDVNEHKPVLGEPEWVSDYGDNGVPEDAYTGAPLQIFTATATDRDATNNGFSYEIVSVDGVTYDSSTSIFAIRAGRVGITSALDYATAPEIMDDTNTVIGRGHEIVIVAIDNSGTGMRSEPGTITVLVANRDDGPAVFEVSPTQANEDILEVEVDTADPDGLDGTYSYQWFTTTDDGVTQVDITNENGRRFDTTGRTDPTGTVYGVRVEYTDNAGTEYSQANGNAPFAVNTTLRFTESYSITLTDGDASPTLPVFADDLELNGDAITTGLEFTFATNGNPGNLFTLSSAGVLTFTGSAVDFDMATDAEKSFNLIIVAEATAGGETTTAIIPVTVEDVNDNDPTLSEPFDTASAASDPRTALSTDDIDEGAGGVGATTSISFEASDADTVFSGAGQTALGFTITATAGTTDAQDIADMFEMAYDSTNDIYTLRLKDGMALNAEAAGLTTNSGVQQIELRIQATDGRTDTPTATPTAGDGLSDARTVTITVNDVNDFDPVFRNGAEHTETISEEMAVGTTVVSTNPAPARDGDATAANRDLTYSIVSVSGGGSGFFDLDTGTGGITLAQKLDYEAAPLISTGSTERGYVITWKVVDQGGLEDTQELTVVVTDEDDTPSEFGTLTWNAGGDDPSDPGSRLIDENTTGTLLTIPISDSDTAGGTLAVRIVSGNSVEGGEDLFVFAKNTANTAAELSINPNRVLNYEDGTTYTLVLEVSDATNTPAATQTVTINVNNLNDESPAFANPVVTWEAGFEFGVIPESTDGSATRVLVGRVAINDADGATFVGDRTFTIAGAGTKFVIERNADTTANGGTLGEGLIYLNAALDREGVGADPAEHAGVTITVDDGVNPAVTSAAFDIEISDVNEHDPVISPGGVLWNDPDVTGGAIDEGSYTAGTTIAFATVTDADATNPAPLRYTLTKGDTIFSISNTGVITLRSNVAWDYDGGDTSFTLAYTVQNVIDGNLVGNPIASGDITLTVNNVNDNDPVLVAGSVAWESAFTGGAVAEADYGAGRKIAQITATDPDRATDTTFGELIYSLTTASTSGYGTYFEITAGGELRVKGDVDFDTLTTKSFDLEVQVTDATTGGRTDTHTYTVTIGNVNEHDPAFGAELVDFGTGFSNGIIPEDTAEGTVIGVVDVSDADGDVLTVTVLPDQGATQALADKFEVVYNMMDMQYELKLKTALDLEGATPDPTAPFGLRLRATDGTNSVDSPADTGSLIVISIGNVDDADPVFNDTHITWNVGALNIRGVDSNTIAVFEYVVDGTTTSGAPAGRKLADLAASDPDTSGALTYGIDNGPQIGGVDIFEIGGANNDELLLKTALDYEAAEDLGGGNRGYTLTLTVSDGRMGVNPVSHEVTIRVLNADEGKAVFAPLTSDGDLSAPAVGDELTFNPTPTTADPDGNPVAPNTFTRTWYRENPDGTGLDTITNASDTYTITSADVGKIVGVIVNYIDGGGTEYLGTAGVRVELANVVVSDFEVTGGAMGTAEQYDTSPVDATGTLTFGTESAMDVDSTGTYTIASQGTYGTVSLVPVNSDMSMGPIVTPGTWTYNVDNTDAAVKALRASDTTPLTDTFKIGVPLTAAAGGGVQEVTVTVDISGVATGAEIHGTSSANTGRAPGNPLDRATSDTFDVIQGGNGEDEIWTGSGGSLVFSGYGGDTITLGDGADTVVHRFWSRNDGAWRNDDGDDVIDDFEVGVDKLVLVDTDTVSPVDLATFLDESLSGQPGPTGGGRILIQLDYDTTLTNAADFSLDGMVINIQGGSNVNGPGQGGGNTGASLTINFKDPIPAGTMSGLTDNLAKLTGFGTMGAPVGGYLDTSGVELTKFEFLPNYFDIVDGSTDHFDVISLAELGIMIEDFA